MIPKGLFTQIAMIVFSIGIIVTFIRPEFSRISGVQDEIALYQEEQEKVSAVNERLTALVAALRSVPAAEQARLLVYMPDAVDTVNVPRILQFITEDTGVIFSQVTYNGASNDSAQRGGVVTGPEQHLFNFVAEGTYGQLKDMLRALEENEFPLEVRTMSVRPVDGDFLQAQITVATYAHREVTQ